MSGIFNNEEKIYKYLNIPNNPHLEDCWGYLTKPTLQNITAPPTLPAQPPCHGYSARR